jgi:hypothetical protein
MDDYFNEDPELGACDECGFEDCHCECVGRGFDHNDVMSALISVQDADDAHYEACGKVREAVRSAMYDFFMSGGYLKDSFDEYLKESNAYIIANLRCVHTHAETQIRNANLDTILTEIRRQTCDFNRESPV